jgi:putative ABC transport system substrate-binding protein
MPTRSVSTTWSVLRDPAATSRGLVAKELEIMKQALPHMTRIGVLLTATAPSYRPASHAAEAAAQQLGVQVLRVPVRTPADLDEAFALMARERVNGFLAVASPLTRSRRTLLAELSLKHRFAGMFGTRENVQAGGLMSYAPDLLDLTRRAATYIDRILEGVIPADLPVEQPTKLELIINLETAKALGLTIPQSVPLRAGEVIQ